MDGKLYLLDFARLYPPESPFAIKELFDISQPRAIFYKMLRPGKSVRFLARSERMDS